MCSLQSWPSGKKRACRGIRDRLFVHPLYRRSFIQTARSSYWKVSETKYAVAVFPHENEPCSKRYRDDSSELKYTTCIAFMVSSSFVFLHPSYHVKIPDVNATCGCILSNLSVSQNNTLPAYCKVSVYYSERIKSLRIKLIQYNRCTRTHKGNVLLRDVRPARGNELKCKHFIRFLYAFSVILIPGDYNGPRIKIITGNTLAEPYPFQKIPLIR